MNLAINKNRKYSNKDIKEICDLVRELQKENKKLLTYYEAQYQFIYQVLEHPDQFFNDNILGKFYTKDLESR